MPVNFTPVPNEIISARFKLKNPRAGKKRGSRIEPEFLDFTWNYKGCVIGICKLLNTLLDRNNAEREFTYKDVEEHCNIPEASVKEMMPVLAFNLPHIFEITNKEVGKGFKYRFKYEFIQSWTAHGTASDTTLDKYLKSLSEIDYYKWTLFKKIPLQYEDKRLKYFNSFVKNDVQFWERNIHWALVSLNNKPEWHGKVHNAWLWKCFENDYGYNKLDKAGKDKALNTGASQLQQNTGIDLNNIFSINTKPKVA